MKWDSFFIPKVNVHFSPHFCRTDRGSSTLKLCWNPCWPTLIQLMKSELYSQQRHFLFTKEQAHTKNLEESSGGRLSQADLVSHKGSCSSETPEFWASCQVSSQEEEDLENNWPHVPWPYLVLLITATVITYSFHLLCSCQLLRVLSSIWVLQRSRTNRIYVCVSLQRWMRFPMGGGLHDYGGWEILQYAVYKLETQESQGHNSVWPWRHEN